MLVLALGLGGVAACSHPTPTADELTDAFVTSGLPEGRARCVSEALVKELTTKQLDLLVERGASGAPQDDPNLTDDAADRLRAAFTACTDQAIKDGEVTTTTAAPVTTGPTGTTGPSSTVPTTGPASTTRPGSTTTAGPTGSTSTTTAAG